MALIKIQVANQVLYAYDVLPKSDKKGKNVDSMFDACSQCIQSLMLSLANEYGYLRYLSLWASLVRLFVIVSKSYV